MRISILGAGSWGTALGIVLSSNGHQLTLWGHRPETLNKMARSRCNDLHLPGIQLPEDWRYSADINEAIGSAEVVVLAVPSKAFRQTASHLKGFERTVVSVTKGIEYDSALTMTGVLKECASRARVAALSGPTLALEVVRGFPSAIVAASDLLETAEAVQKLFHRPSFRVYTSTDLAGVELGGALKNVIAIGAGVGDGLGFGDNSKAALVTRGIAEIRRLGTARGAQAETFAGLSGLGDLMVTCFSKLSRNRTLGERLGRGENLEEIIGTSASIAEGVPTARSAYQMSKRLNADTPIIDEVYAMLYEGKNFADSLRDLMNRSSKAE